ncbi:MAG: thiol oxidoreductase [Candidatus Kapabacteria bacterium]|nr:thiol oxidoreductase [Candidatus Kapabacteria bacterium]
MNNIKIYIIIYISFLFMIAVACESILPTAINDDELLDGPIEGLNNEQITQFSRGDFAFNNQIFTTESGLGPIFVSTSCGSCHFGDGKGTPENSIIRFGKLDSMGNPYQILGSPQLQYRSITGYSPEKLPINALFFKVVPPAITGLGYLALVSDSDIISMSDPDDKDNDGISGVVSWGVIPKYLNPNINSIQINGQYIFRFGKKATSYNLFHQTVKAYNQDIGIASQQEPIDVWSGHEIEPEISSQTVIDVHAYLNSLKAPIQRNQSDEEIINGKKIFVNIGCGGCHKETLKTGYSDIEVLSNKVFHPYTDLLLHNMGSDLDDGYTEGSAKTFEWRTPALWGLGLSPNSQGGKFYLMHDGRANSIEEAILMHGGEATLRKLNFQNLPSKDKNNLLKFLNSL